MFAAVVSSFASDPRYGEIPAPAPTGPHETLVDVVASGLHPRVRSQARGSHYTSGDELPLVPGIDGIARMADGTLRYFVLPDTTMGAMAQQTVIDLRRSVELPSDADPILVAAAMNPAMSAWIALTRRIDFVAGQSVLILGATGNAGRLAVQVARRLGASRVIAAGRNPARLAEVEALGAGELVPLDGDSRVRTDRLAEAGAAVDVVLDYLWGAPTAEAITAIVPHRVDDDRQLSWVQIGSAAGVESAIPSAALRATRLQLVGSGQGSVSARDIVAELPSLVTAISSGAFRIDARAVALSDVEAAWADVATQDRIVLTP